MQRRGLYRQATPEELAAKRAGFGPREYEDTKPAPKKAPKKAAKKTAKKAVKKTRR